MKNCLIVLGVMVFCFFAAAFLWYALATNFGRGFPGGTSLEVAEWRDYEDQDIFGLEVVVWPDQIEVEIPATPVFKQVMEKGHWSHHSFYCDSHVDSPAEVVVAHETKDENLVVDISRFVPSHAGKISLVKMLRGKLDQQPPYPKAKPGDVIDYPPPKGLIRAGMLECDLDALPWRADRIESTGTVVHVDMSQLSDGGQNKGYYGHPTEGNGTDEEPETYTYHSDRHDAPNLLVTVYHGRVTEVNGGAEETADIPFQLAAPSPPADNSPGAAPTVTRSWGEWLCDLMFTK